jgi:hypothetical protein
MTGSYRTAFRATSDSTTTAVFTGHLSLKKPGEYLYMRMDDVPLARMSPYGAGSATRR